MSRILAQHGNVIAADFRPRLPLDLSIAFKSETLYLDSEVLLLRTTVLFGTRPLGVLHFLSDLATGHIVQLNNHG